MKETGIIMSSDHPKLILDGAKAQTRRVIKPQPERGVICKCPGDSVSFANFEMYQDARKTGWIPIGKTFYCPYGQVGDRLWVRETWMLFGFATDTGVFIHYKASEEQNGGERLLQRHTDKPLYPSLKYRSARFMPKAYSRIALEITEVRVERVQEISEEDIKAEGIQGWVLAGQTVLALAIPGNRQVNADLWDSLNAKRGYGWAVNPWVWAISFKLA